jgi:hypothetical protein
MKHRYAQMVRKLGVVLTIIAIALVVLAFAVRLMDGPVGPWAGGAYRPEAFTQSGNGDIPEWGVEIARQKKQSGKLPFIQRFDVTEKK